MNLNELNANVNRLLQNIWAVIAFLKEFCVDGAKDVSITYINADGSESIKTFPNIAKQMSNLEIWKNDLKKNIDPSIKQINGYMDTLDLRALDPNKAYPIVFMFSDNSANGLSEILIKRVYSQDAGKQIFPESTETHVAAVNLHLIGNGCGWHGDANFCKILHHSFRYAKTVARVDFLGYIKTVDLSTGEKGDGFSPTSSIVYLRGGVTYNLLTKNMSIQPILYKERTKIYNNTAYGREEYVEPIPFLNTIALPEVTTYYGV